MRHPDDRRLGDGRVLVEDLLDLPRVDVVAAADDQVLLAVDDEEVTLLVDPAHIAGVDPAGPDGVLGRLGPVPVALHAVVAWMRISPTSPCGSSLPSSPATRISTPAIGVPIEPALRSRPGWLKEATGDVSDRPYPSRMMHPNACSNARMTSTGIAAFSAQVCPKA